MSYLDGTGVATLWAKVKQYVIDNATSSIPDLSVTTAKLANNAVSESKLSTDVTNKINPVSFGTWSDFLKKVYGGTNAVMTSGKPYMFVGQASWTNTVIGYEGYSWGICFCYSSTVTHVLFMCSGQLYKLIWSSGSRTVTRIPASGWVSI